MHKTNEEVIAAWNAGEEVLTCSMGGMSKEYEQNIQTMVFVMFKAMLDDPPDWPLVTGEDGIEHWAAYCKKIDGGQEVKDATDKLGPSAAQHSAALSLASVFAENGYIIGMNKVPDHRRIKAKKYISEEPPSPQASSAVHQPKTPEQQ